MSPETPMPANARPAGRRMKRKTLYVIATGISMVAYGVLLALSHGQSWLVWPAIAAALIGIVFACLWMAALDEAAQQAHYISWFWGGSAGLVLSMVTFATVTLRPEAFEPVLSQLGAAHSFAAGIIVGVMPPAIGYAIWWVLLWLRRG
jgi:hypothetical protein